MTPPIAPNTATAMTLDAFLGCEADLDTFAGATLDARQCFHGDWLYCVDPRTGWAWAVDVNGNVASAPSGAVSAEQWVAQ